MYLLAYLKEEWRNKTITASKILTNRNECLIRLTITTIGVNQHNNNDDNFDYLKNIK